MFKKAITLVAALLLTDTNAVTVGTTAMSRVQQKAYLESGRELLELYYRINSDSSVEATWEPEIHVIMDMVDMDEDGKITFDEMKNTIEAIAKLFDYEIDPSDRGEMEFLWSMMDTDKNNELTRDEVEKVLTTAPLTKKINAWA